MIVRQYEDVIRKLKSQTRRTSTKDTYKVGHIYSIVPKRAKSTVYYLWDGNSLNIWHEINPLFKTPLEIEGSKWKPLKVRILSKHWEPLHNITEEGAMAEGIKTVPAHDINGKLFRGFTHNLTRIVFFSAIDAYMDLWDSINGKTKFRWRNNPQVCVHKFELVEE